MKAMLFAAGLGTRLKNETLEKPKALVDVAGKSLLERAIENLKSAEISEIVVNIHHFSEMIITLLNSHDFGIPIHISNETNKLLDTGGGLKKAAPFLEGNEPILMYNVDILSNLDLKTLTEVHINSGALATLVVRNRETQRYLKFNREKQLVGWINRKTGETKISRSTDFENATEMAFSGIHIVQPGIFKLLPHEDRFSIINVYLKLAESYSIKGYFDESTLWMDVGKPEQLEEARRLFSER